jgi:predicted AAA+ superfamily ATPase
MALVNLKDKEIQVINIYYGPGRGGKTSILDYVHRNFANRIKSEMATIKEVVSAPFF